VTAAIALGQTSRGSSARKDGRKNRGNHARAGCGRFESPQGAPRKICTFSGNVRRIHRCVIWPRLPALRRERRARLASASAIAEDRKVDRYNRERIITVERHCKHFHSPDQSCSGLHFCTFTPTLAPAFPFLLLLLLFLLPLYPSPASPRPPPPPPARRASAVLFPRLTVTAVNYDRRTRSFERILGREHPHTGKSSRRRSAGRPANPHTFPLSLPLFLCLPRVSE